MSRISKKYQYFKNTALMELSMHAKRALNKPNFISLELSELCFLKCKQCNIWKNKPIKNQLSFEQRKAAILSLKNWLKSYQLNITGGEPLMNSQTLPLISFAESHGIPTYLNSNGFKINEFLVKQVMDSNISNISISIDSVDPKTHDYIRGVVTTHKKAIKAIKLLTKNRKSNKQKVSITTIILNNNAHELIKIALLSKKLKTDGIIFQPLMSKYSFGSDKYKHDWHKTSPLWPKDTSKLQKSIDEIIDIKKKGFPINNSFSELKHFKQYFVDPKQVINEPCLVGYGNFLIDVKGDVRLCFSMKAIGNISKGDPQSIWVNNESNNLREKINSCKKTCRVLLCNRKPRIKEVVKESALKKMYKTQ